MNLTVIYHAGLAKNMKPFYDGFARSGVRLCVIVPKKIILDKTYAQDGVLAIAKDSFEADYNIIPVDLINVNKYSFGFRPLQLFNAIKQAKPDVIHVWNEYDGIYAAQAIFARNILFKKAAVVAYSFENTHPGGLRGIAHALISGYSKRSLDAVTGANSEALARVKDGNCDIATERIFWGVDLSNFQSKERNLCRKTIGIPENIKLIGYFGRIVADKGLDRLCEVISKDSRYHWMLIGNGSYENALNKLIDSLRIRDRVYFYDSVENARLLDYYNCLDVFVLPSQTKPGWKEQYGRVLVEAMACNVAIVGSTSGAIPEVLAGYPRHLIFEENSTSDLIDKINQIDKLKSPENFDLKEFLNKFSIENFVAKHIEFYDLLLRRKA